MEFLPDGLINLFPAGSIWLLVIPLIIGPFIQEDTAVLYAASLSVTRSEDWMVIFAAILCGLILSDSWKYWLGWAAKHHDWAKKFAQKDRVVKMKRAVLDHSGKTLFAVRFLPMARIPTYLATGFFGVSYVKYMISIAISALAFVTVIFTAFHILGEILGEKLKTYMPLVALGIAVLVILGIVIAHRKMMKD